MRERQVEELNVVGVDVDVVVVDVCPCVQLPGRDGATIFGGRERGRKRQTWGCAHSRIATPQKQSRARKSFFAARKQKVVSTLSVDGGANDRWRRRRLRDRWTIAQHFYKSFVEIVPKRKDALFEPPFLTFYRLVRSCINRQTVSNSK